MIRISFAILALVFVQLVNGQDSTACTTAQTNLATNTECITAFSTGTDTDAICMGTCRDLFNAIIANCDATTAAGYSTLLSNLCIDTTNACTTAQTNLATNTACVTAFSTGTDTDTLCMGTCRDLFNAIISNCDATTAAGYSTLLSTLCIDTTDACTTAQTNLAMNTACVTAFSTGTDTDAICTGTCRDLFNAIISSCDATTAAGYSTLINNLCDGGTNTDCETAGDAVDAVCLSYLNAADSSACSGTCGSQLATAVAACASSTDTDVQLIISAYNTVCGSGAECTAALNAFNADTTCTTAIADDDSGTYCTGTCRTLLSAVFSACPDSNFISQEQYNQVCGTGSGSGVLKASGVITLLLVAICALIF